MVRWCNRVRREWDEANCVTCPFFAGPDPDLEGEIHCQYDVFYWISVWEQACEKKREENIGRLYT